jgi:hypothetical protein
VLKKISGPTRYEVKRGWRLLHNEELHNLYFSLYKCKQIKEDELGGACSRNGKDEKFVQNFSRKPERKRLLWRPRLESSGLG